jgi:hypothetical protein
MKRYSKIFRNIFMFILSINLLPIFVCKSQQSKYEEYYLRSNSYPILWTPGSWFDHPEIQGVTHDDNNWYFTWTYNEVGYLWRVPVEVPLDNNVLQNFKVDIIKTGDFSDLAGYWHWGDPDHYKTKDGREYIVVPMTRTDTPIVAIFRTGVLYLESLVAYGRLTAQTSTGWCAIHPQTGELYTSEDFDYALGPKPCNPNRDCDDQSWSCPYPRMLLHYRIPWDSLPITGYKGLISLTYLNDSIVLQSGNNQLLELYNMQGGEFTPSGELLYVSCGGACCFGYGAGQQYEHDGVYVFDTRTWTVIKRSTNHLGRQYSYFDYYYWWGCDGAGPIKDGSWSPEGLTIWDRDDGRSPNIRGQLHVLGFHSILKTGDNEAIFEHYGNRLHINPFTGVTPPTFSWSDQALPGDSLKPFKTFNDAYNWYPAWGGSEIVFQGGLYYPTVVGTFSRPVRLTSQGGTTVLGK